EPILAKRFFTPEASSYDEYCKTGPGYKGLKKALEMKPADVIDTVKKSGLRGRG
ncbi:MAG TPA: NADH-quinone oxidoreductase subunit F, partial [Planctomycetes bacterium]|nr:NADH-quinone oxidoreductase subunit F [Planctomycetota bacterium]